MPLTFPTNTKIVKDEMRNAIGQDVTFEIIASGTACPTCQLDPINQVSIDPFCITCSGAYWLGPNIFVPTKAHVRWKSSDIPEYGVAGQTFDGDASVTIDINALTASQVVSIKAIYADSRELQPTQTMYRGVPTRDRIRFICQLVQRV